MLHTVIHTYERRFPDTGWSRLLADLQLVIAAVDAVISEGAA